jgi:hypothetical protein
MWGEDGTDYTFSQPPGKLCGISPLFKKQVPNKPNTFNKANNSRV